jgi:Protein of unknown function (DUF2948)
MTDLKLIAFDTDDLAVVSAHMQDAIVRIGDMAYVPRDQRFAAIANRFDWQGALALPDTSGGGFERRRTALRVERVTAARFQGVDLKAPDTVLSLLAMTFEPNGPGDPAGAVTLTFAAQARLRLEVECLEIEMTDLGGLWAAKSKPSHGS